MTAAEVSMSGRRGLALLILGLLLVTAVGCTPVGDPGYTVAVRNESDLPVVVRRDGSAGEPDGSRWLLPPHAAGVLASTVGPPRVAQPIDYEILEEASCLRRGVQHVDFALAPDPGFSYFLIVVRADLSVDLVTSTTSDPNISGDLPATTACAA